MRIRDEVPGAPDIELDLELDSAELSVRELIRGRVTAEIALTGTVPGHRPLVPQSRDEHVLNGPRPAPAPPVLDEAVAQALSAFARGRFLLIVDGRQLDSADTTVRLTPDSEVRFLHLVPLRGG